MFTNIGRKIKILAYVITILGIISSLVVGIYFISIDIAESKAYGIAIIILGSLISWASSFVLYGLGQLIEDTAENKMYNRVLALNLTKFSETRCDNCGNYVVGDVCPFCNTILDWFFGVIYNT